MNDKPPPMPEELITCAQAPCRSCPYRRDVPSGLWAASEYDKLPAYDGDIAEQVVKEAGGLFFCHQQDGRLCAGWIGCHGAGNLLAVRLAGFYLDGKARLDDALWTYESPVPLFASGAQARAHGLRAIRRPGPKARRTIDRLQRKLKGRDDAER
jgi:hypothetical protein